MIRLVYISTVRGAHDQQVLDDILLASRRNNAAAGVTGLLVAGGNRFLQVLEGPEDAVERTYNRISSDPRHLAPVVLGKRHVTDRSFERWAMGFQPARAPLDGGTVEEAVAALVASIDDVVIRAYFDDFVQRHASPRQPVTASRDVDSAPQRRATL